MDVETVKIHFDDGRSFQGLMPVFHKGKTTISGQFYGRYGTLEITTLSGDNISGITCWVGPGKSFIVLAGCATGNDPFYSPGYPFGCSQLANAIDIYATPEARAFERFEQEGYAALEKTWASKLANNKDPLLRKEYLRAKDSLNREVLHFLQERPNEYFTIWTFPHLVYRDNEYDKAALAQATFETFPDTIQQSFEGREIRRKLYGAALRTGVVAPTFTTKDIKGKLIDLKQYAGKYVLLDFWATWCQPCTEAMPIMKQLNDAYPGQLVVLSITPETNRPRIEKAVLDKKMTWPVIMDKEGINKSYGDRPLPSFFVIDPEGKIIFTDDERDLLKLPGLMASWMKPKS